MRCSIFIVLVIVLVSGCKNSQLPVTKISDYQKYMRFTSPDSMPSLKYINTDIDFWMNRLKAHPGDAVAKGSLARLYSARFKTGGAIDDIHTSDSLYLDANTLLKTSTSSLYRSLATNCITQHKFRQARLYLDTALELGDDKYLTYLMRCDVFLELGLPELAEQSLQHISPKNNFDHLIREAKLLDHKGDLDAAIEKMEQARDKALASKNETMILWAISNLGDMYGHANRFKESYECYLNVLERKPDYLYALKGIAWLAFSHDKNTFEAKRIINYLAKLHAVPDYNLLLAEIAAYEKNNPIMQELQWRFISEVGDYRYGEMYNSYVFDVIIEEGKDFDRALQIAEREVNNRPTAASYDLVAWAYYNMGKKEESLRIAKDYVENKTHEPDAMYHLGKIYAGTGNIKKAKHFLTQANDAGFELGPVLATKIEYDLKAIQ